MSRKKKSTSTKKSTSSVHVSLSLWYFTRDSYAKRVLAIVETSVCSSACLVTPRHCIKTVIARIKTFFAVGVYKSSSFVTKFRVAG